MTAFALTESQQEKTGPTEPVSSCRTPSRSHSLSASVSTEARAGAALAHPSIPTIYQTGECQAGPYCAMEYIDGQTLASLIHGRMASIRSALDLLIRVADAVAHAHAKGIIHRDLKPGNIMLARSRRPPSA